MVAEPSYVTLAPGVPKARHFTNHALGTARLPDPLLGIDKPVMRLTFIVDEEDGRPVAKTYSITSSEHRAYFERFLGEKAYANYTWTITRRGDGFRTKYSVTQIPR